MNEVEQAREKPRKASSPPPPIEWVVAAIGLVLVAGSIGFLVYEAMTRDDQPPNIVVEVEETVPVDRGHLVTFRALNRGGETAEGVVVSGELRQGDQAVETSETTIDYIPGRSERGGGLFFTRDPNAYALHLRAQGYEEP